MTAAGNHPAVAGIGVQAELIGAGRDFNQFLFQGLTPQDIAAAATRGVTSSRRFQSNIPARHNLPFVGRDDLLNQMLARLGDPSTDNVIVLHGAPGVGKSELAREFARRHRSRYSGGTFIVDAGSEASTIDLARIGQTFLDLNFPADLRIEDQGLRTLCALGAAPSLLIFDNVRSADDARSMMPPASMPCHVVVTTVLDRWDAAWQTLAVEPLSNEASLQLIEGIAGHRLADRHGQELATLAGGLPVQLVPASATLAYEARRGRENAITLTLAQETSRSFQGVYAMLEPPARLLLHAASRLNSQRIIRDELAKHLVEAVGWSADEFQGHLDACLDVHVIEGTTELRMHQLFVAFLFKIGLSGEIAQFFVHVVGAQARCLADIAASIVVAPNRADLAATLMTYPITPAGWTDKGGEILLEKGEVVGDALTKIGRFANARPWYERAVAAKEKGDAHGRVDHQSLGLSLHQVGYCLTSTGHFVDARPWCERAVAAQEKGDAHGRADHASLGSSLHQVGCCLALTGQFADACPWFERAVAAKEKGDARGRINHESLGLSLHLMGYCLASIGQFADARPWFERAVSEGEKGDVDSRVNHESVGTSLHHLGHCLTSIGQFAEARPWFERAITAKEKGDVHGRVDHTSLALSLHQVGYCLSGTGQFPEARPWFERAVTEAEKGDIHSRVNHESLGKSLHQVGVCLASIGRFAEAHPWFERAVTAKERGDVHGRVDHQSLGLSLHDVGYCLSSTGQFADARRWYERAIAAKEKGDLYGRVDQESLAQTLRAIRDLG